MKRGRESPKTRIEDFRGDFRYLSTMMKEAWKENPSVPFLYEPDFLEDCFRYPGASFALAPAIYQGPRLLGFVAGFPRHVRLGGATRRLLIAAFLTAAPEVKSSGYGILVWSELMQRARAAGFDGVVNYTVDGDPMSRMIEASCRRLRLPVRHVRTISYLSRLLWRKRPNSDAAEEVCVTTGEFMNRAATPSPECALARVWTAEEAAWQLDRRGSVVAAGPGLVRQRPIAAGYVMPLADTRRTPCLVIEDLLWDCADPNDRCALAQALLEKAAADGARLAIAPVRDDADVKTLLDAGFKPSRKRIHAYLSLWDGEFPESDLASYYLDVF